MPAIMPVSWKRGSSSRTSTTSSSGAHGPTWPRTVTGISTISPPSISVRHTPCCRAPPRKDRPSSTAGSAAAASRLSTQTRGVIPLHDPHLLSVSRPRHSRCRLWQPRGRQAPTA
jgi:hypothetical protein